MEKKFLNHTKYFKDWKNNLQTRVLLEHKTLAELYTTWSVRRVTILL